jgi:predicted acyltransferase
VDLHWRDSSDPFRGLILELVLLSSVLSGMSSTQQQLIYAEWEAFTRCEKEGPSHSREDRIIQGCLDT